MSAGKLRSKAHVALGDRIGHHAIQRQKAPRSWGLVGEPLGNRGSHALSVAVNFPRSAFLNRASAPFAFISLSIAE